MFYLVSFFELGKGILMILWQIFKAWWWVPVPFFLFSRLKFLYLWQIEDEFWSKMDWTILELKTPMEVERPLKAMEQVINHFWTLYDPPDIKEVWVEGKYILDFELEIASINGKVRFFLRIPGRMRKVFESAIYSQYPDVEIEEVDDYTKLVPQNIPNKEWDMWACNFELTKKETCYPIKTYSFFEPTQETKEEKRIDPLSVLIEGMSRLKEGEQLWLQLRLSPVSDKETNWVSEGKETINKLVRRPPLPQPKSITGETIRLLATGKQPFTEEKAEESVIPPEMKLTPGERDIVQAIENKISKQGFRASMRMIYLGKRDVFFKANLRLILNFSVGLSTQHLNGFKPVMTTKIVSPSPFRKRRLYLKQRQIFRKYVKRQTPYYPKPGGTFVLNTEEIATMFHFPSRTGVPTSVFPRIEAKKGSPPSSLPIEE